jgi:hypothetical protein
MTRDAWKRHKDELMRADPAITRRRFVYTISRASYRKEWGNHEPGLGLRLLVVVVRVLPKVGPLKATSFKPPLPAATTDFERAFVTVVNHYRSLLAESAKPGFSLPNRNFDTGKPTRPAEYRLADDAYGDLAIRLAKLDPSRIDPKLRDNVLAYFNDRKLPFATKQDHKEWRRTQKALDHLRGSGTPVGVADGSQQQQHE